MNERRAVDSGGYLSTSRRLRVITRTWLNYSRRCRDDVRLTSLSEGDVQNVKQASRCTMLLELTLLGYSATKRNYVHSNHRPTVTDR